MLQFWILVKYSLYVADDVCKQIVKETVKTVKMVFSDEDKVLIKKFVFVEKLWACKIDE